MQKTYTYMKSPSNQIQLYIDDLIIITFTHKDKPLKKLGRIMDITSTYLYIDPSPNCRWCRFQVAYYNIIDIEKIYKGG